MLIECLRHRPGGTYVGLGEDEYHFRPRVPDGPHVDEVVKADHLSILLAIAAYRVADAEVQEMLVPSEPAPVEPQVDTPEIPAPAAAPVADEPLVPAPAEPVTLSGFDGMSDEQVAAIYTERSGKAPHHKVKRARQIELIEAAAASASA